MTRGRPSQSEIREKITALLEKLQFSYGYEIYKYYKQLFDNATSRVIYYHLRKGSQNGEFVTVNVKRVLGNYTWGDETERVYYALGPFAKSRQEWSRKASTINSKTRSVDFNWLEDVQARIEELKKTVKTIAPVDKPKLINKCDKLTDWVNKKIKEPNGLNEEISKIRSSLN